MRFLMSGFFHQTTPPGPTRDVLEPFLFLSIFRGVMYILKRLPGIRDTGESQFSGVPDAGESQITGVPDAGKSQQMCMLNILRCPGHRISIDLRCPGHRISIDLRYPGHRGVTNYRCPGYRGVHLYFPRIVWYSNSYFCGNCCLLVFIIISRFYVSIFGLFCLISIRIRY